METTDGDIEDWARKRAEEALQAIAEADQSDVPDEVVEQMCAVHDAACSLEKTARKAEA